MGEEATVGVITARAPVGFDHRGSACAAVGRFARADLVGAMAGLLLVTVANAAVVQSGLLWIVPPALAGLVVALWVAARAADDDHLLRAVALITIGNWTVALIVPIALPFLWPVLAIVVVMPLVLAAPFVPLRPLVAIIAGAASVGAAVALIGLESDDAGAIPDISDELELIVVVSALAALMVPMALIVWLNNRSQREALETALRLNDELAHSQERLVESRRRVVEAGDAARSRIERDLHDGVQQQIVAIGMKTRLLASRLDDGDGPDPLVDGLVSDVDRAVDSLRELAHGIYPPVLEAHGLGDALDAAARRSVSRVIVANGIGDRRLGRAIEEALYFTALEAMANAAKHVPDAEVRVVIEHTHGDRVELRIEDNGPGFDVQAAASSTVGGLANMRDRVETLGGHVSLTSSTDRGTTVRVTLRTTS